MALSSRAKNKLMDTINTTFASIGRTNGMRMPRNQSNLATYAWDYFVACHLASMARKRKDEAERAAVLAGVLFDADKEPKPEGSKGVVYNDDVNIVYEVRKGSPRVSVDKMADYLAKKGVRPEVLAEAREAATTWTKPAHMFTAYLNEE